MPHSPIQADSLANEIKRLQRVERNWISLRMWAENGKYGPGIFEDMVAIESEGRDALTRDVLALIGTPVFAIKLIRERTLLGLRDAKLLFEKILTDTGHPFPPPNYLL